MRGKSILTKWLLWTLFILATWLPVLNAHAQYGGGTGEPNDPYLIYTAEQMITMGSDPNLYNKHFMLAADINLEGYIFNEAIIAPARWVGRAGNIQGTAFSGSLDGKGFTIQNLSMQEGEGEFMGLFGLLGQGAQITNLGLLNVTIHAKRYPVGGVAGLNASGKLIKVYCTGTIVGDHDVGGLVGKNESGIIINSHSAVTISGNSYVGGLVGLNDSGDIHTSYSISSVNGIDYVDGFVGYNSYVGGLVGYNSSGTITNCFATGNVSGHDEIGGLAGRNDGLITASYASVNIHGQDAVGGLVGSNYYHGEIVDCYANGDVLGQSSVGGLLGKNELSRPGRGGSQYYGTIQSCYSTAVVSGDQYIGGLVGSDPGGGVSDDCFWDIETSGQTTSDGGMGLTTAEMQDPNMFIDAGWDFFGAPDGPSDIWAEPREGGYPVLWWQLSPVPELPTFSGGTGTPNDPYLISTADELNSIGHNPRLMTAHFKLINDIDMASADFFIIANQWYPLRGTFDGNRQVISNISYASAEDTCAGFISYAVGVQIKDLGLIGPNIQVDGGDFHGALVGLLETGTITNCYVESGSVSGNDYIGGLVGKNGDREGIIMNCYSTGSVRGNDSVGGLVGINSGTVINCYSHCSANGSDYIGGLVGSNYSPGEIINCYAKGDVHGKRYVSGLLARNFSGSVIQSFWDAQTSGWPTSAAGGTGLSTAEMHTAGTFLDAGWDFIGETDNGTEDIWWMLEGQDYPRLWWE